MEISHPISDLVDAYLEAAQAVVASIDPESSNARPAELTYELDQVVSNYLDAHQLSLDHYDAIQQDVVNTIAHQFNDDASDQPVALQLDEHGNAGLTCVISLLDHHYSLDLTHQSIDDNAFFSPDMSAHHGGLA
jgi:hypothetical protein